MLFIPAIFLSLTVISNANPRETACPLVNISKHYQNLKPPHFPGGEDAFHNYLIKNSKWPIVTTDIQGIIIINFAIEKDGTLTEFKIEKGLKRELDAEALRVIRCCPKWKPALRNGKPIRSTYSVPIAYSTTALSAN
ncbi:MAG: TonB family protein [Mucilaginibacter sp.]|nr:TonB family protein [Mucilaginibacter sp.]